MFYLTMHSKHFILWLFGIGHMVRYHSNNNRKPVVVTTWATVFN